MKIRKFTAGFEMIMIIISLFALCHFANLNENIFATVSAQESEQDVLDSISNFDGVDYVGSAEWNRYPTAFGANELGCCFISKDGQRCGTSDPEECLEDSPFVEGMLCAETAFCEKGCCFNEDSGTYDKNVLRADCNAEWVRDPNCNMVEAKLGCCFLGDKTVFETEGECRIDTLALALGNSNVIDWRSDLSEGECFVLSTSQEKGACLIGDGNCKFISGSDCSGYRGDFYEGQLCTSSLLDTNCEMTRQTKCVDGEDRVYFIDSCGNAANVYDASRVADSSYWDFVIEDDELCGSSSKNGNADSRTCGNCNRFLGGVCSSALEDGFDVDVGNFYCSNTNCMFKGEVYENGESWCVYDGVIGEGKDVIGSRHWKYVCSQGDVIVEPCADYRNQICVQTDDSEVKGKVIEFKNAACVANNWRKCIDLNSEEDGLEICADTLNCRIDTIDIADKFTFDACLPKYPGGFSLNNERYQVAAETLCGMANQKCTVVRKPKTFGGCKWVANKGCLDPRFTEEMNDFCMGLGDCGGSVNILGEYVENYDVLKDGELDRGMFLSDSWIGDLIDLANPIRGQFAEVEDYSEYLAAAGIPEDLVAPENERGETGDFSSMGQGISGIGLAIGYATMYSLTGSISLAGIGSAAGAFSSGGYFAGGIMDAVSVSTLQASTAGFATVAIGAGIGMVVGGMLAKHMGLSEGGSTLMAIGGGLVGASISVMYFDVAALAAFGPYGIAIGLVMVVVASFFGGSSCDPIEIEFKCKPWTAPIGGDKCEECNNDPLKPCSEYRCSSLGAACELVNVGTDQEMCSSRESDGKAPVINPEFGVISDNAVYDNIEDFGFSLSPVGEKCFDAYDQILFGITTNELAHCKFDIERKEFEDMNYDLGTNNYLYNHTSTFNLPDPGHGESQGLDWNGELSLYIKCQDVHGTVNPGFYSVDMCVKDESDNTAPKIKGFYPKENKIIGTMVSEIDFEVITNELSTCRWSANDVDYLNMENNMDCEDMFGAPSSVLGYSCKDILPLSQNNSVYYIRCGDQPWLNDSERNFNSKSFVYNIRRPENAIKIVGIMPSEDLEVGSDMTTIELSIETFGGGNNHFCSYSFSGYENMIDLLETGNDKYHKQVLNVPSGMNKIFVECRDETGDFDRNSTEFEILQDNIAPSVARVWQSGGRLHVLTNEDGECRYSLDGCNFVWDSGADAGTGSDHLIDAIRGKSYYVKCRDKYENVPNGCSIIVRAL